MDKYLQRRWKRALEYTVSQIQRDRGNAYRVASSAGGWYSVLMTIHNGVLWHAHCRCPDWGQTRLHGVPVCKHVLAVALCWYLDDQRAVRGFTPQTTLGTMLSNHRRQA